MKPQVENYLILQKIRYQLLVSGFQVPQAEFFHVAKLLHLASTRSFSNGPTSLPVIEFGIHCNGYILHLVLLIMYSLQWLYTTYRIVPFYSHSRICY